MHIERILYRQARSPWTRVQARSKPGYCGKSVVYHKVEKWTFVYTLSLNRLTPN